MRVAFTVLPWQSVNICQKRTSRYQHSQFLSMADKLQECLEKNSKHNVAVTRTDSSGELKALLAGKDVYLR